MNIFKFLKIQRALIIIVFFLSILLFFYGVKTLKINLDTVYNDRLIPIIKLHEISDNVNRSRYKVLQVINNNSIFNGNDIISLVPEYIYDTNLNLDNITNKTTTENELVIINSLTKFLNELNDKEKYIFDIVKSNQRDTIDEALSQYSITYAKTRTEIEKLIELQKMISEIKNKESTDIYNNFVILLTTCFILTMSTSVYLSINIRREVNEILKIKEYQEKVNNQILQARLDDINKEK